MKAVIYRRPSARLSFMPVFVAMHVTMPVRLCGNRKTSFPLPPVMAYHLMQ
jgi:hypothetical protein